MEYVISYFGMSVAQNADRLRPRGYDSKINQRSEAATEHNEAYCNDCLQAHRVQWCFARLVHTAEHLRQIALLRGNVYKACRGEERT